MATNFNYCPYCGSPLQKNNKPTIDDLVAHKVEVGDTVGFTLKDGTKGHLLVVEKWDDGIRCVFSIGGNYCSDKAMYSTSHLNRVRKLRKFVRYSDSDILSEVDRLVELLPKKVYQAIIPRHITQRKRGIDFETTVKGYLLSAYEVYGCDAPDECVFEENDTPIPFFADNPKNREDWLAGTWLRTISRYKDCNFGGVNPFNGRFGWGFPDKYALCVIAIDV